MKQTEALLKVDKLPADQLVGSPYAFAIWRCPGQVQPQMILSLSGAQTIDVSLGELPKGFLVNPFQSQHPVKPYFLKADIQIQADRLPEISPSVSASQMDELNSFLDQPKNKSSIQTSEIQASSSDNSYTDTVTKAILEIQKGRLEKVVPARKVDLAIPEDFSFDDYFELICNQFPNAFCSLFHIPGHAIWIGATPESFLSIDDQEFRTVSLAGTKELPEDGKLADISWTQKEIEEQAFVSRYIINCFKKIRLREFHEHGPKTIKSGKLAHLKTEYIVNLSEVQFDTLADQMMELLHPTAAVCGMPLEPSLEFILENESFDREFYAGFLGPVNFDNRTDLFVNLRCMKVTDGMARFYAGAGITEDSNPEKEFEETELKISALRSLL